MSRISFHKPTYLLTRRAALFATAAAAFALAPAAHADPLLSGTAGSGANTFFFTLDFRDFAAPQSYAFAFKSDQSTLTFEQVLNGLTAVPTFSLQTSPTASFGTSLDGISYAGKTKFNVFGGANSGEPNGYFSQWSSPTGLDGTWAENQVGISFQTVNAGNYVGASWVSDFNNPALPPRTPQAAAAAAPEPGTLALLLMGGGTGAAGLGLVRRRKAG